MHTYVCLSGVKKCYFFGEFRVRAKWMIPKERSKTWRIMHDGNMNVMTMLSRPYSDVLFVSLWTCSSKYCESYLSSTAVTTLLVVLIRIIRYSTLRQYFTKTNINTRFSLFQLFKNCFVIRMLFIKHFTHKKRC